MTLKEVDSSIPMLTKSILFVCQIAAFLDPLSRLDVLHGSSIIIAH